MFNQLYVQTEYSLLQSSCKIMPLVDRLKSDEIKACAICDEGTMYGTIKFYQACKKNNIKPIIGLAVDYIYDEVKSRIILYAMNEFGYKNLMKISSRIKLNNGTVDFEYLAKTSLGILAIIPYTESVLYKYDLHKDISSSIGTIELLKHIYDILYIGMPNPKILDNFDYIYNIYKQKGYNLVALPKVSFIDSEDVDAYITLKSIRNNANLYNITEQEKSNYLYSKEYVNYIYSNYKDLIYETNKISSMCNITIEFGKYQLPEYQEGLNANEYLRELCILGLKKRLQTLPYKYDINKYIERIEKELDTIKEMGFSDYFLIVFDYVKYAKKNDIYVGPGRGSAGASLVGYSLGITDIDPIYHNLLFERFLNKERISMPDIDIDFEDDRRDEVIKYVGEKYKKSRVAHICTFGTFKVKMAINDCARVYKLNEARLKLINRSLENVLRGKSAYTVTLEEAIKNSPDLLQLMDDYEDIRKVLTVACKIQGIPRNTSTHAAGIVITKYDLVNYTPLDIGLDDIYQTQYEASDLEALGLLKMDFLGLKNLTNIARTIDLIKKDNPSFSLPKVENDFETYKMLANGDVSGVFQLESAGMRKVIMQMKTSSLEDIIQALALYRPGPMDIIPTFIKRKFKEEEVIYPHEDLKSILEETYGTIVYQEQIMLIACKFAGYTLGRADILRRAVSKKKKDVLEEERKSFVEASIRQGYTENVATLIYDYIVKFADYGFNKAHSVAYAKVAYITAYLKCHYFPYYFSTLMSSFMGSSSDVLEYTKEATSRKIKINGPSINQSSDNFEVINKEIYFPISIIRGLGNIKTNDIIEERNKGLFTSFEDFVIRTKDIIALSLLENIIYSGALDEFGLTKKAMIENYLNIIEQSTYTFVKNVIKLDYTNEEYSYGVLQEKEIETIGINLKYNFFKQCESFYNKYNLIKISDITENKQVRTMGIIKKVREIETKQKEKMAFVELGDDTSNIEVVFFPRIYNTSVPLNNGMILMVGGNTQKRTTLQVVADYIKKI